MNEFLTELIQTIAVAVIPVCAAFLIQFLRRKTDLLAAQLNDAAKKHLLAEVTDAVSTAVAYTSQTYVDVLKKDGIFDTDAQQEALRRAFNKVVDLLSKPAKDIFTEMYGDLSAYLTSRIEAEVRAQKR